MQFHLLIECQLILDANRHPHVQRLNFALRIQHFVELSERQLLVDLITLHRFMQRFHRSLKLPLEFVEARGGALHLAEHECLLRVSQRQLALMLHDHFGREHVVRQGIVGRARRARRHLLPVAIYGLQRRLPLRRCEQTASENDRD